MFCEKCGQSLTAEQAFCSKCGTAVLKAERGAPPVPPPFSAQPPPAPTPPPLNAASLPPQAPAQSKKKNGCLWAVVIFIILRSAYFLSKILGNSGIIAISRIVGFLTIAIGIQYIISAILSIVRGI